MKLATQKLLAKAERAILAAERLVEAGDAEFAAGRAYYAMFYLAGALLDEKGLRFRKHGGVHAAFGEHFAKTGAMDPKYHRWLLRGFDRRIAGDYGIEVDITPEEAREMIAQARDFLDAARQHFAAGS